MARTGGGPRGHSNVGIEEIEEWRQFDEEVAPGHARIPIRGGSGVGHVRPLPPLAMFKDEWELIGRKMGWLPPAKQPAVSRSRRKGG